MVTDEHRWVERARLELAGSPTYRPVMSHKVVVWGTGNVGVPALRTVVSNPALELVAVLVSNPEKVGRDAGELVGLPPLGIRATDDIEAVLGSGADAVAYCASGDFRPDEALADFERCLRAGLNVVSTSVYPLYDPTSAPEQIRSRMEAACTEGGASCFVSGIDPGFINDVLPLALSGLCEEIPRDSCLRDLQLRLLRPARRGPGTSSASVCQWSRHRP